MGGSGRQDAAGVERQGLIQQDADGRPTREAITPPAVESLQLRRREPYWGGMGEHSSRAV